ncbi:hypothetical protein MMC24_000757 [Lignoscripta atroalba]|nr:hypothetical protein [Lignoscripta atroalba]
MGSLHKNKLTLYTSVSSQWAGVAHLGLAEKQYPKEDIEFKEIDLMAAENFHPQYRRINPAGTVPSLVIPSSPTPLTESRAILEYLDLNSPPPSLYPSSPSTVLATNTLIALIHSPSLDTTLLLLTARSSPELAAKKSSPFKTYITNRQRALEKFHAADPENHFYASKLTENTELYDVYSTDEDHSLFFEATHAKYHNFAAAIDLLDKEIRLPYAAGEEVTFADFHIAPWLAHALAGVGTTEHSDFEKLDAKIRETVPEFSGVGEKIKAWWERFGERECFKEVFERLH